jgi:hypothetical protein
MWGLMGDTSFKEGKEQYFFLFSIFEGCRAVPARSSGRSNFRQGKSLGG